MIFLGDLIEISEDKYQVGLTHRMPFDEINGLGKSREELEVSGFLVDSIPEQTIPNGYKAGGMFINPKTMEIWYEYEAVPPTPEELLQAQIDEMSIALAAILGGAQ